ncbi:MAG: holo-ACP synthase [Rickettsiales bacterium]|jgi:holo-[acyl-carrier protein] synthase
MILGIGSDLVDVRRIERSLTRYGRRFEERVFTANEQKYARRREDADIHAIASIYAKRFAAKEACAKALGTGIFNGVFLRDIEVVNSENGAPNIRITGGAFAQLQQMTPKGMKPQIFLSLSDEYPYAQGYVIISAIPVL